MKDDLLEMERWLLEEIDSINPDFEDDDVEEVLESASSESLPFEDVSLLTETEEELEDFEDEDKMREILLGQGFAPKYRVSGSLTPQLVNAHVKQVMNKTPFYYLYMKENQTNRYYFKQISLEHPAVYQSYVGFEDYGKELSWKINHLDKAPLIRIDQYHLTIKNYRENKELIQLVKEFRARGHIPFYIVRIPKDAAYQIRRTPGCEWLIQK